MHLYIYIQCIYIFSGNSIIIIILLYQLCIRKKVMLTSALRPLVKNSIKESFYKKKKINVLTVFSFLIKIMSKLS